MLLRSAGEACTRIADETVAIRWYKKHLCPKKYKGVWAAEGQVGGKNKGFVDKTNNRRLLRSSSRPVDYVTQIIHSSEMQVTRLPHLSQTNVLQHAWVFRRSCQAPWSSIWQLPTCRRNPIDPNLTIAKIVGFLTFQVRSTHGHGNNTLPTLESSLSLFLLCRCQRI